jgi:hypothetical protein
VAKTGDYTNNPLFSKIKSFWMPEVPERGAEESTGCAGCFARVFGNAMIPMPLGPSAIGW